MRKRKSVAHAAHSIRFRGEFAGGDGRSIDSGLTIRRAVVRTNASAELLERIRSSALGDSKEGWLSPV